MGVTCRPSADATFEFCSPCFVDLCRSSYLCWIVEREPVVKMYLLSLAAAYILRIFEL